MIYINIMLRYGFLFCLMFSIGSCIEPIIPILNKNDSESTLVVDGQITNEEGPFKIRLTKSIPVNVNYYADPVLDADVTINDDKGNVFQLPGVENGWYITAEKNLKAVAGNTYTLTITTKDKLMYQSSPVLIQDVPDIDSIYFRGVTHTRFENNKAVNDNWLNIYLDTQDPSGVSRYWRFEFEETWQVEMLTSHIKVVHSQPGTPFVFTWEDVDVSEEKKVCWVTKSSSSILVASTANNQQDVLKGFLVQSLGPGEDKLYIKYSILVKQSSISSVSYNYWKQLMDANENIGSIYDKVPAQVYGNIKCLNGTAKVLGTFSASTVKTKRIFIDRSQHEVESISAYGSCLYFDYEQLPWIPESFFGTQVGTATKVYSSADFCADCRSYGTNVKPDFWK
jgi:hypothetical protein